MGMRLDRRRFLQSGSVCLALRWLESRAGAAVAAAPKRMVCICTDFGLYGPAFFPQQPGKDYEPSEYLAILLAGGSHRLGRHIQGDTRKNTELGKVFISMLQQFGVEADTFGHSRGTLAVLAS